jgi:hypothetical protein
MHTLHSKVRTLALAAIVLIGLFVPVSAQPISVTSFSPTTGAAGTVVTVFGTGFPAVTSDAVVRFGGVRGEVLSSSSTVLTVRVPAGASYEPLSVTAGGLTVFSPDPFRHSYQGIGKIVDGMFGNGITFSSSNTGPRGIVAGDLDGDTIPDLGMVHVFGNSAGAYRSIGVTDTISGFHLSAETDYAAGFFPMTILRGDIDNDGQIDLLTVPNFSPYFSVFRNLSSVGDLEFAARHDVGTGCTGTMMVVLNDFDVDGKIDVALCVRESSTVYFYRNTSVPGSVSFAGAGSLTVPTNTTGIIGNDFDGDGKPDIATINGTTTYIAVRRNLSTPGFITFSGEISINGGRKGTLIGSVDADVDGRADFYLCSSENNTLNILRNLSIPGNITFDVPVTYALSGPPLASVVSDIDGDTKPDLVITTDGSAGIDLFENISTGIIQFEKGIVIPLPSPSFGVVAADLNGDAAPDLIVTDLLNDSYTVFQNFSNRITTIVTNASWNLLSIPRVPVSPLVGNVFQNAVTGSITAFTGSVYLLADTLQAGKGYWAFYYAPDTVQFSGVAVTEFSLTIPTGNRWVLIGSLANTVPVSNIVSSPPSALAGGSVFGFNGSVYTAPATIEPGRGYWLYVYQPCTITVR